MENGNIFYVHRISLFLNECYILDEIHPRATCSCPNQRKYYRCTDDFGKYYFSKYKTTYTAL